MEVKARVVFMSKTANLNIIKKKGATIVTAVPGGTRSEVTPTSWIKFREHKYVVMDPEEIGIIRAHIKEYPKDGIMELIPKTPEDVVREKEIKLAQLERELTEAREVAGTPDSVEEVSKKAPEPKENIYTEKCPDCEWVAESSVSEAQTKSKLRGHRAAKHKSVK